MRHRWGEPDRTAHDTVRACINCGLQKITRHEGGGTWIEFWRDDSRIEGTKTPPCEAEMIEAKKGRGAWFFEGTAKFPAVIDVVHSPTLVDLTILDNGSISARTSVPLLPYGDTAPGNYATLPAHDDQPDLDAIAEAKRFRTEGSNDSA